MPSGNSVQSIGCPRHEVWPLRVLRFVQLVLSWSQKPNTRSRLPTEYVHGLIDFTFTENLPKANRTVCNLHTQSQQQHEMRRTKKFVAAVYAKNSQITAQTTRFKYLICTSVCALTATKCSAHVTTFTATFSAKIGHIPAVHVTNAQQFTR
jgi:hypothetical protein